MRILVSGAGIAGPVAAYWLARYGRSDRPRHFGRRLGLRTGAGRRRRHQPGRGGSRKLGRRAARVLLSMGPVRVWAVIQGARLVSHLPTGLTRVLARLGTSTGGLHDSVVVRDYAVGPVGRSVRSGRASP